MNENIKDFYAALSKDEAMKSRAQALNAQYKDPQPEEKAVAEDIAAFAKSEGFAFTAAEFTEYNKAQSKELSDDELEAVAGGASCICPVGGGGTSGLLNCICAIVGYGERTADCTCNPGGVGSSANAQKNVCFCFVGGSGKD